MFIITNLDETQALSRELSNGFVKMVKFPPVLEDTITFKTEHDAQRLLFELERQGLRDVKVTKITELFSH